MPENSYLENLTNAFDKVGEDIGKVVQKVLWDEREWDENFKYQSERKALAYIVVNSAIKLEAAAPILLFFKDIKNEYVEESFSGFLMEALIDAFECGVAKTPLLAQIDNLMADKFKDAALFEALKDKYAQMACGDLPALDLLKKTMPNLAAALYASPTHDNDFFTENAWLFTELYPEEALAIAERQFRVSMFDASHGFMKADFEKNPAILNLYVNYPDIYKAVVRYHKASAVKGEHSPLNSERTMLLAEQDLQKTQARCKNAENAIMKDYMVIMGRYVATYKKQNSRTNLRQEQKVNAR